MHTCHFCHSCITEAFVGSKNEGKVYSCFKCFIQTLKPSKFDEELVYYPMFGIRKIQPEDSIAFYDKGGYELARVYLKSYNEGFLSHLKEALIQDKEIPTEDITLVIEPYNIQLKE
ncbi:hypothetical protein NSQ77_10785 [Oceanobacillus sp. FSL K6-2867]|uniref:hypothetical protein n=1 Tax=Oceanobacillus sp. FSL K6-2867 TaxID=2954748 RepID=UPI0030D858A5